MSLSTRSAGLITAVLLAMVLWAVPSKVVGSGIFVQIGSIEGTPLFIELPVPDPDFPAFRHCPRLAEFGV